MNSDLTFFTNEPGASLLDRFKTILKHVQYFDVLVGYFRTSGFLWIYEALEDIDKIRILVGLKIDPKAYEIIEETGIQRQADFESHSKTKRFFSEHTIREMDNSEDSYDTEVGIGKFIEFLTTDCSDKEEDIARGGNGKKLEFRAYPSKNLHAKVYISRFPEGALDYGRVITGSSNFSESGLVAHREFNVELKNRADVEFALNQFENLWKDAVDISEDYVETIRNKTWLNDEISPYDLYLKMLYEYLKEDINLDQEIEINMPLGFLNFMYQKQAVVSAKKILDAYNGVFLADVMGLGKTFISALLAKQLPGGKLIICPPVLKEYWEETFFDFGISAKVGSLGKLDKILKDGTAKYDYVFVDEAHRFRNEYTGGFEKLHQICFGKKVILVSATPLNNTFQDIFSQLKLFQIPKKSTIPGVPNLEKFFKNLEKPLKNFKKSDPEYIKAVQEGSREIREKVLKYVMVRRTRSEIVSYFSKDIKEQGLFFPEVEEPRRIIYEFDQEVDAVFNRTIDLLRKLKYARYTPLLYLKKRLSDFEQQSQRNVGGFMKSILVKRLESSFFAFRKTLDRFVESYEKFIKMLSGGKVLISKKINVYDLLNEDSEERILELLEEGKIQQFESSEFTSELDRNLRDDLEILGKIRELWKGVDADPKLEQFVEELKSNQELAGKKVIIFTESKETGEYLHHKLNKHAPDEVLFFSSHGGLVSGQFKSKATARELIKENFDPNCKSRSDKLRILISTDVLSEGINLHRSNIIINYDLPWNPTKVLQRVGRVNRVGTEHRHIYIFNFFPTAQSDDQIGLEDNIKAKIQAFHDTLGEDAKYLTEEEIVASHGIFGNTLYNRLNNKRTYESDDGESGRSELEYLQLIRETRDNQPKLFERIKRLPRKARSGMVAGGKGDRLITFFRKGKLKKFFITDGNGSEEITFFDAVDLFLCEEDTMRCRITNQYYPMLDQNKSQFDFVTSGEEPELAGSKGGRSNESYVIRRLKAKEFRLHPGFTDEDEEYIRQALSAYAHGVIPQNTTRKIKRAIERESNPHKVLGLLKNHIPYTLLGFKPSGKTALPARREVILSGFLAGTGSE